MKPAKLLLLFLLSFLLGTSVFAQQNKGQRRAKRIFKTELRIDETSENDAGVEALGLAIEKAIAKGNSESFLSKFDTRTFGNTVTKVDINTPDLGTFKQEFIKGMQRSLPSLPNAFAQNVINGGYYDFINYEYDSKLGTYTILFRLFQEETGINYHRYLVSKLDDDFVFNDLYIFVSGEFLSQTMNRMYLFSIPKKKILDIFEHDKGKDMLKLMEAVQLNKNEDFEAALEKLHQVKGLLSKERFFLIMKSLIAANINDAVYKESIESVIKHFPNDPSLYLIQSDYYLLNKDYEATLTALNNLEAQTEDDFLNFLKGNVEVERSNWKAAMPYFKQIMTNYPEYFPAYASYLMCVSNAKDFDAGIPILDSLLEYEFTKTEIIDYVEELNEDGSNEFEDFAKSDAYLNWKKQS